MAVVIAAIAILMSAGASAANAAGSSGSAGAIQEETTLGAAQKGDTSGNANEPDENGTEDEASTSMYSRLESATVKIDDRSTFTIAQLNATVQKTRDFLYVEIYECRHMDCASPDNRLPIGQYSVHVPDFESGEVQPVITVDVNSAIFVANDHYAFRFYMHADDGPVPLQHNPSEPWAATTSFDPSTLENAVATLDENRWLAGIVLAIIVGLVVIFFVWISKKPRGLYPPRRTDRPPGRRSAGHRGPHASGWQEVSDYQASRPRQAARHAQPRNAMSAPAHPVNPPANQQGDPRHSPAGQRSAQRSPPVTSQVQVTAVDVLVLGRISRALQSNVHVRLESSGGVQSDGTTDEHGRVRLGLPAGSSNGFHVETVMPIDDGFVNDRRSFNNLTGLPEHIVLEVGYQRRMRSEEESQVEGALAQARASLESIGHYAPAVFNTLMSVFDTREMVTQPSKWGMRLPEGPSQVPQAVSAYDRATRKVADILVNLMSSKALVNTLGRIDTTGIDTRAVPPLETGDFLKQLTRRQQGADDVEARLRDMQNSLAKIGKGMDTRLFDTLHKVSASIVQAARDANEPLEQTFMVVYGERMATALRTLLQSERLREELRKIGPL